MPTLEGLFGRLNERRRDYLSRRPHRTFKLTRRRDVPKPVPMPGYIAITSEVVRTLWQHRLIFGPFLLLYVALATLLVGIVHQGDYTALVDSLKQLGPNLITGKLEKSSETLLLFGAAIGGGLTQPLDQSQQINLILLSLFAWLVVVWLLRQLLAGNTVKMRDGLYNAGAPFLSTFVIVLVAGLQLVPGALGVIVYATANSTGAIAGGAEAMAFGIAAFLLAVVSLYWVTSTALAGIIVTLPGTYPFAALKTAGDLAFGRRSVLVLRLLWMILMIVLFWAIFLVPTLLIDTWLQQKWLPLVPVMVQALTAVSVLYTTSYIYIMYRKMIDAEH